MFNDYSDTKHDDSAAGKEAFRLGQTVKVPAKLVRDCGGFSLDIGGSVIKIVFRTKTDYEDAQKRTEPGETGTVHMTSFSRAELGDAIEFITEHAHISRTEGKDTMIYVTGFGSSQFQEKLEKELNIKYLLKNIPVEDLLYPFPADIVKTVTKGMKAAMVPFLEITKSGTTRVKIPNIATEDISIDKLMAGLPGRLIPSLDGSKPFLDQLDMDKSPIALAICGSGGGVLKVESDGYVVLDFCYRSGRSCLAMSSLLLGCKSYEEFLDLAEKGNCDNVDYGAHDMARDVMRSEEEKNKDDIYQSFSDIENTGGDNLLLFNLGKGVGKSTDDFRREDLARGVLRHYVTDMAQVIDKSLREVGCEDVNHVFFSGSFPSNEITRSMFTQELTAAVIYKAVYSNSQKSYQFHFLKSGAHLGSLGCLISSVTEN